MDEVVVMFSVPSNKDIQEDITAGHLTYQTVPHNQKLILLLFSSSSVEVHLASWFAEMKC